MVKAKFLLFLFLLVVLSSFAFGALSDDLIWYYDFDSGNDLIDIGTGNHNLSNSGTASGTGILGESRIFIAGESDSMSTSDTIDFDRITTELSGCYWYNSSSIQREGVLFMADNDGPFDSGPVIIEQRNGGDVGEFRYGIGHDAAQTFVTPNTIFNDGVWTFSCFVLNASNDLLMTYKNGTNVVNTSVVFTTLETLQADVFWGCIADADACGSNFLNASIDEASLWNRSLSSEEIATLYNSGTGCNFVDNTPAGCAGGAPAIDNFLITANDNYGNTINVFNASFNGTDYNTSTGTINTSILNNVSQIFNITFSSGDWFSQVEEHNISSDLTFNVTQSEIKFQALEKVTENQILNFTVNDSTFSNTTIISNASLNLLVGNNTLSFSNPLGYYNFTFNVEVFPRSNFTFNISNVYDTIVTILGFNFSGSVLPNLTGNVTFTNGFNESFNSSNSSIDLNLTANLNYTFFVTSNPDFTFLHHTNFQSRNVSVFNDTFNFTLFADQSIFFSASDVVTGVGLSNFNLTLSGASDFVFTGLNISTFQFGITTGNYNLLVDRSGYASFSQLVSIVEGNLTNVSALMTNVINEVIFIVNDVFGNPLSGVSVRVTRSADDSLVASGTTDGFGEVQYTLNDLLTYNLNVTKTGFIPIFQPLTVIEDTYVMTLEASVSQVDFFTGLLYEFSPVGIVPLVNNTVYNFTFNLSSSLWNVTSCRFDLLNGTNVLATNTSFCNGTGGFGGFDFNTGNHSFLTARVIVGLNSTNISFFHFYNVKNFFQGEFSLMTVLDDIKNFGSVGFDDFSRFLLVLLVIVGLTVSIGGDLGFVGEPSRVLIVVWLLVAFFSVAGLLTVSFVPFANDFIILIFISLLVIAGLIVDWKVSQSG